MKYLIVYDSSEGFLSLLVDSINSKDVRSEIECFPTKKLSSRRVKKILKSFRPDILIIIGSGKFNGKLILAAKELDIRSSLISGLESKKFDRNNDNSPDLILSTWKTEEHSTKTHYIGHPVLDQIKNHEFDNQFTLDENETNVVLISDSQRIATRIKKGIGDKCKLHTISGNDKSSVYNYLKHCNAALTTQGVSTLEAVFFNCPQVIVNEKSLKSFFYKDSGSTSLVNLYAGKKIVNEFSEVAQIKDELMRILNDQQYCATMLDEYQGVIDEIGHERASKKAAQIIVDFLESSSS